MFGRTNGLSFKLKEAITSLFKRLKTFRFPEGNPGTERHAEWSIGIYSGESPVKLVPSSDVENPVLTCRHISDRNATFVADPFIIRTDVEWFMFFEIMNRDLDKGEIGLAASANGLTWQYQQVVLTERFHLSYPYVFQWMNDYYMIPESCQTRSVRLYRALKFPTQWSFVGSLLNGTDYVDSSIFRYDDTWWLMTACGRPPYRADSLRLFYANALLGPWLEHHQSPIVPWDLRMARPAGRVLVVNDRPIRYAQDCYPTYGSGVRAFEIEELSLMEYREREVGEGPILTGSGVGWNASGMHHIDAHIGESGRWMACVDGWFYQSNEVVR